MHNHSLFEFVGQFSSDLAELARRIEDQLLDQPHASLIQARLYTEQLVKIISQEEGLEDIYPLKHAERIHKLFRQNAIEEDIYMKLEWIRKKGNKAAHDMEEVEIHDVLQVHKFLFEISVWYMQVYVSYDFEAPAYKLPIKTAQETNLLEAKDLDVLIKPYLDQTLQKIDEMWSEVHRQFEAIRQEKEQVQAKEHQTVAISKETGLVYGIFTQNNFKLTNETSKAAEFENMKNNEVVYLLPNKEITIVLNPNTVENHSSFKNNGKYRSSTALKQFPKKINKGQKPINYGYSLKFKTEDELDSFLKSFNNI